MADVLPFRGLLYNPDKIKDLKDVFTPPYDVISEKEQNQFYERSPYNVVRLILGKIKETDTDKDNRHTRSAVSYNQWLSEGILKQDSSPAFYLTTVEFYLDDKPITRYGLIAAVRIEPFEKGIVLPHERTFSKVKSERLGLMKACHANFSQIFSLYSDQNDILNSLKAAVDNKAADIDIVDDKGHRHKLWRITDTNVQRHVSEAMKDKSLFIADGHHRYETALNYRNQVAENDPDFTSDHPANFVMMYLCSMQDPGLVVLPAHRMLKKLDSSTLDAFLKKAENYFDIMTLPFEEKDRGTVQNEFMAKLEANRQKNIIGVLIKDRPRFYLLSAKPGIMEKMFGNELSESLRSLDVTVLTRLIFMELLGFDQAMLDNEALIGYTSIEKEAIEGVLSGEYDITFILNPTKIEQVSRVAEERLTMPRKSTYFYPKTITGQVLNKLTP